MPEPIISSFENLKNNFCLNNIKETINSLYHFLNQSDNKIIPFIILALLEKIYRRYYESPVTVEVFEKLHNAFEPVLKKIIHGNKFQLTNQDLNSLIEGVLNSNKT